MGSVMPTLVTADRNGVSEVVQHAWDIMLFSGILVALETLGLRSDLISVIAGRKFADASTPLGILGVAVMVMFLSSVINVSSVALNNYRILLLVQLPSLVMQILLSVVLVPLYGVSGAALAILGSESCSIIASAILFRQRSGIVISQRLAVRLLLSGCVALLPALLFHHFWSGLPAVVDIVVEGAIILVIYVAVAEVLGGVSAELLSMQQRFLKAMVALVWRRTRAGDELPTQFRPIVDNARIRAGKWSDAP
jgi:O-antigen/teichoic acid export membrane protein